VSENKLQKKIPEALKEKTQYAIAFGVIATMLFVAGFPMFVITFFGIFAYFLWRTFTQPSTSSVREVFEFYLSANEILRDDEKRWFGFEVQEVIALGENILQSMNGAPPLVYFTLGTLYNKVGNHKAAVNHLAYVFENEFSDESNYAYATPELKNYVKILRKIEREPAEAPLMSAAVRALERTRRNRGKAILENSREALKEINKQRREDAAEKKKLNAQNVQTNGHNGFLSTVSDSERQAFAEKRAKVEKENGRLIDFDKLQDEVDNPKKKGKSKKDENNQENNSVRKPITELLHDIYDDK
jgi:CHASE3 domain sensor protein